MIDPTHRVIIYALASIGFFAIGGALDFYSLYAQGLIACLMGINFALLIEILIKIGGAKEPIRIIHGENELRKMYEKMKDKAHTKFYATWSGIYNIDLEKYFDKERRRLKDKQKNFHLFRLINIPKVGLDEHLRLTQEQIKAGKYRVKKTDISSCELHYCDYRSGKETYYQALLVFHRDDRRPDTGIFMDSKEDPKLLESIRSIRDIFLREWRRGTQI